MATNKLNKKLRVFNKYNGRCAYCGRKISLESMTIDHWIPKSDGGDNNIDNLFPSCLQCNKDKSNEPLVLLRMKMAWEGLTIKDLTNFNTMMKKVRKQKFYY